MTDVFTKEERSKVMSLIRSKDTKPEMQVRKSLHSLGFRFRLHDGRYPGKPDMILPKYKTAIQVRGCFWHGHACKVAHRPRSNVAYWKPKITRNKERDQENDRLLREAGWNVIVIWECVCRKKNLFAQEIRTVTSRIKDPCK